MRNALGQFKRGHEKIGGFIRGSNHTRYSKQKISKSLIGKHGKDSRRWKGDDAGYVAKHIWIVKHFGKATHCSLNPKHKAKRFEWHNVSGEHKRLISDYIQLCPSCHRFLEKGKFCKRKHEYTPENTYWRKEGWRVCKICQKERYKKWKQKNA